MLTHSGIFEHHGLHPFLPVFAAIDSENIPGSTIRRVLVLIGMSQIAHCICHSDHLLADGSIPIDIVFDDQSCVKI